MADKTYDHRFKLLMIGDHGVGKPEILLRFTDNIYERNLPSCIGMDFKSRTIEIDGIQVRLQTWDTNGQERFRKLMTPYYRKAAGVFIVYDITSQTSFESVPTWLKSVNEHGEEDVVVMVLGNRCENEDRRRVPKEIGESCGLEHGISFMETSAKENINIDEAFHEMAKSILTKLTSRRLNMVDSPAVDVSVSKSSSSQPDQPRPTNHCSTCIIL